MQQLSQIVELASSPDNRQFDFEQELFVKELRSGLKESERPKGGKWQSRVERVLGSVTSRQAWKVLLAGQKALGQLHGIQPERFGLLWIPCMLLQRLERTPPW
jgi:hypothetical protein